VIWAPLILLLLLIADSSAAEVPSSERSRAAVARVEPRLQETLAKRGLKLGSPVYIRIFKQPAQLELWIQKDTTFKLFRVYDICKFSGDLGPKLKEGDRQAPEGTYTVAPSQMNPNSSYHLSFNLGYPNAYDRHHRRTGSALMVHGACASIGCYAMGNDGIEEIWTLCVRALEAGQPSFSVHCFPFRLTPENLQKHTAHPWIAFWRELQPIYQHFEQKRIPPRIRTRDGKHEIVK
jgi:murein L,D-transpeptidase YafK